MTWPALKLRQVTLACCGEKSCMASTYSSVLPMPSSSDSESITDHAEGPPGRAEVDADVGVVGIERWAERTDRCDALEGARDAAEITEDAEAEEGLCTRLVELALLRAERGVRGRPGLRPSREE